MSKQNKESSVGIFLEIVGVIALLLLFYIMVAKTVGVYIEHRAMKTILQKQCANNYLQDPTSVSLKTYSACKDIDFEERLNE